MVVGKTAIDSCRVDTQSVYDYVAWHNSGSVQGGYAVGIAFYMAGRYIGWVQGGCAVSMYLYIVVPVGGCKVDMQ